MKYKFDQQKNSLLLKQRNIGFEKIIETLTDLDVVLMVEHSNKEKYPNQKLIYTQIDQEIFVVPCVVEENGDIFLKTIFPSRKARQLLLKNNASHPISTKKKK